MDIVRNSVDRLVSVGYADAEAWRIVKDFMKNYYSTKQLTEFIKEKEKEYVDKVQQQSTCGKCGRLCDSCGKCGSKCTMG